MNDLEDSQIETQVDEAAVVTTDVEEKTAEEKKSSSVVKLLKQRTELKNENEKLRADVEQKNELAKRLAEMEEMIAKQALDQEARQAKNEFFTKNPNAKEYEQAIEELATKEGLSLDKAFKLYAAENNPELLMDEQFRNKSTSNNAMAGVAKDGTTGGSKDEWTKEDANNDPEGFLAWSAAMEKKSRAERGFTN